MLGVDAPWRQGPGDHGSDLFNATGSLGIGILRRETAQMRRGHCSGVLSEGKRRPLIGCSPDIETERT